MSERLTAEQRERGRELLHELMQIPGVEIGSVDQEDVVGEFLANAVTAPESVPAADAETDCADVDSEVQSQP